MSSFAPLQLAIASVLFMAPNYFELSFIAQLNFETKRMFELDYFLIEQQVVSSTQQQESRKRSQQ